MRKIKSVKIEGFWGTRTVTLDFDSEINFLIGVNGSGKTTIINLIAASLKADFATLDKAPFSKIRIDFFDIPNEVKKNDSAYIEIEKKERIDSPYPNINFKLKVPGETKVRNFLLNELEEEVLYRYPNDYLRHKLYKLNHSIGRDVNTALEKFINVTWLSIHRANKINRNSDDSSFESLIDQKIKELSTDLVKYFGLLDKQYSTETEKFQKNIFLSLIEDTKKEETLIETDDLDSEKEKESLRQIFLLFKLKEAEFADKLEDHFTNFDDAKSEFKQKKSIGIKKLAYIMGTRRIHSIVQEWGSLNATKNEIHKPKVTFLSEVNSLLQNKQIFINEKNELLV